MPTAEEVERLYAPASAPPPLYEPPTVARVFASLYREAREVPGAVAVTAHAGTRLAGFGYGHPWSWWRGCRPPTGPALRLYRAIGWQPLGHGPDAPDGRPGLVLVRRTSDVLPVIRAPEGSPPITPDMVDRELYQE